MALIALDRMGATTAQQDNFYSQHSRKLELRTPSLAEATLSRNLHDDMHLPRNPDFETALKFFTVHVQDHGYEAVIREYLPKLATGISASAFHCVIRLAYALETELEAEICMALAYWAAESQPLELSGATCKQDLMAIAQACIPATLSHTYAPGIIIDRMAETATIAAIREAAILPENLTLDDIAKFTSNAYAQHDDFTLLHTVTGCHALRSLLPYANPHEHAEILREFWKAALIAFLSTGLSLERQSSPLRGPPDNWEQCFKLACASGNDHTIKIVYSAHQEYRHYGNPMYAYFAQRAVGLLEVEA